MRATRVDRALAWAVVLVWAIAAALTLTYLTTGTEEVVAGAMPGKTTVSVPPESAETRTETPVPQAVTVAGGGDVLGDRTVGGFIDTHGASAALAGVADLFREADVAVVNLENPLSERGAALPGKDVVFRGRPSLAEGLAAAGVDVAGLANNHALDYGPEALLDTLGLLRDAGVEPVGAGPNLAEARRPVVVTTPGATVSVLAFSHVLPEGFSAGAHSAGVNPTRPAIERMLGDVAAAAAASDWVVVGLHWGVEYQAEPTEAQRDLARRLIDAGADLILGHHPHVVQGLETYRHGLVAYSLGGLLFDHYSEETGRSFVLRATLRPGGPPTAELVPIYLSDENGVPAVVTGAAAEVILSHTERLSRSLGTELRISGDRAYLD